MFSDQKGLGLVMIILLLIVVSGVFAAGFVLYNRQNDSNSSSQTPEPQDPPDPADEAKKEAIRQAQSYTADEVCAQVLTPAVHNQTGASYVFPAACVPEGWTPEESNYVSGKIKTCPDEWYEDRMPRVAGDNSPNQYLIIKGERKEIADYDMGWIQEFCPVNQPTVVE